MLNSLKKGWILGLLFYLLIPLMLSARQPVFEKIQAAGGSQEYPGANLLTIFDSTVVDVQPSGLSYVVMHKLTKVLTVKGALRLRTVIMDYDPLSAAVEIRAVRVYRQDGTVQTFDLAEIRDYPAPARAIYWGARQKMLEVGRLEPGDALETVLFRKGFTYALLAGQEEDERFIPPMRGHFYDIVEFWSGQPVMEKVYRLTLPQDKKVQYEVYNGEVRSSAHFSADKSIYTFCKRDIKPFEREPNMVATSDEATKLLISTSPDWYAKSKWFYGVNEDYGSFEVTPEVQKKVDELLQGADGEDEKIARLTHWVADNIRYSGISMGPGEGYTLHKGAITFRDRCGVCKDKAGLLVTMLRAAGFESYAAMTMAGSRIDYIPADQFNHSVTIVKKSDGRYHLLDPTWVPFVRELWSSAEQQQQFLMGPPEGMDLGTTPLSPPEKHYYRIKGKSEINNDGTLTGSFTLTAEGQSDARFRRMFTGQFRAGWQKFLESQLRRKYPQMILRKTEFNDPYDYSTPLMISIDYEIPGFALVNGQLIAFTPLVAGNLFDHPYLNDHLFVDTDSSERNYQFRTRCSKLIELSETIKLPKYSQKGYLPAAKAASGSGADFSGGYQLKGRTLKLNEKIVLKKRIYDPADWPSFREAVLAQKKLASEQVILQR